jgi:hypothetical protein
MPKSHRLTPRTPAPRMTRAPRLRPIRTPRAASSAWMRGAPYVPRDAPWMAWIGAVKLHIGARPPRQGPLRHA